MAVYKDKNAKANPWYFHLEMKDENGKRKIKKKRGFRTKKEAEQAFNEAQNQLNKGIYLEPSKLMYSDYLSQWLQSKKTSVKPRTIETYSWLVNTYIIPNLGSTELSKLTSMQIQKFYNKLVEEGRLVGENVQKIHTLINDSLKKAEKWELIPKNVATHLDRPKKHDVQISVWDVEEAQQFLKHSTESRYHIAFVLALTTGMRQGEILGLRWKDINFDAKTIHVAQTLSHDGKTFGSTKTKTGNRVIAIDDDTVRELVIQRKRVDSEIREAGKLYQHNDLVVCTNIGTPTIPRNLVRAFDSIILKAKVSKIRFHEMRHTHGTLLLKQNVNPKIVSERLGHADVKITMNTYSHLLPNMQREVAAKFGQMFFSNDTKKDTNYALVQ